ncbi:DegT/DnrJ/EryC1/StrS family aminotransferase [Pseudobdellovibrio sp. HCB154]|uniref:DegT/DnrJ/EryC1/StrS family aminotransferase n=1 Tax=Pseudobdellovibrio sp. HCB154 TaxID=3386277 RepID=UPI003917285C
MSSQVSVPLFYPVRSEQIEQKAIEVLRSGFIATGKYVDEFTNAFGQLIGKDHVVTINDVSNAVQIALFISDVQPGDEIIATPFSCMSSNSPIALAKAKVKWLDIDPATGTVDVQHLKKLVSEKTKALIVYHVAGYPADMQAIVDICKPYNIKIIEDCNNALLADIHGKQVGSWGDFSVYSFYPNRQINAGEGGALVCRRLEDAERAKRLRRYGIDSKTFRNADGEINPKSDIPEIGWGATLNNLCSAMGLVQVDSVAGRIEQTRQVARKYDDAFKGLHAVTSIKALPSAHPSYWVYMLQVEKRSQLMKTLKENKISCSILHQLNTAYTGFSIFPTETSGADKFFSRLVCIPCGWWMDESQIAHVQKMVTEFK